MNVDKINLQKKFETFHEQWKPKVVAELNGQYVKLVRFRGEFVWHHHDWEDEMFLVIEGRFTMKFRDRDRASVGKILTHVANRLLLRRKSVGSRRRGRDRGASRPVGAEGERTLGAQRQAPECLSHYRPAHDRLCIAVNRNLRPSCTTVTSLPLKAVNLFRRGPRLSPVPIPKSVPPELSPPDAGRSDTYKADEAAAVHDHRNRAAATLFWWLRRGRSVSVSAA